MASNIKYDLIEDTKEYKEIVNELEKKIDSMMTLLNVSRDVAGACHIYWNIKKNILKEDYNMEWKSPSELNPDIIFD